MKEYGFSLTRILGYFLQCENYHYRSYNEIKTGYFNISQVTLHLVVISTNTKIHTLMMCKTVIIVSDNPRHDAKFVYGVTDLTKMIKKNTI